MAHEVGIDFDLFDVAEIFKTTPYIADLKPGGNYVAKDMYEAGGVYMLMKTLLDGGFLHGNCMTVTGKTLGENIDEITWNPDQKRSEEHTSALQSLMRKSYAVFCLKKKKYTYYISPAI